MTCRLGSLPIDARLADLLRRTASPRRSFELVLRLPIESTSFTRPLEECPRSGS